MPGEPESLRAAARRLHAHFEVQPEQDLRDGERVAVALVLRLWAVHEKGARALPGCARCRELRSDLERIAAFAGYLPARHTNPALPGGGAHGCRERDRWMSDASP